MKYYVVYYPVREDEDDPRVFKILHSCDDLDTALILFEAEKDKRIELADQEYGHRVRLLIMLG